MKIVFCIIAAVLFMSTPMANAELSGKAKEIHMCKQAKWAIEKQLLDADSAKFECAPKIVKGSGSDIVLVRVNGKNAFGGYTGWQLWGVVFMADGSITAFPPEMLRAAGLK